MSAGEFKSFGSGNGLQSVVVFFSHAPRARLRLKQHLALEVLFVKSSEITA